MSAPGVTSLLGCRTIKEVPAPDFSAIVNTDSLAVGRKNDRNTLSMSERRGKNLCLDARTNQHFPLLEVIQA